MTIRVGMVGNVGNTLYQIAKLLRSDPAIDVHLHLDSRHHPQMLPESDDPELASGYPHWIHRSRYLTRWSYLFPWSSRLARELRAYDLVIASGEGPIFAQFAKVPWAFFVTGSDLTMIPFPVRFRWRYKRLWSKLVNLVLGSWQRRGIARATEIWSQPFAPFRTALDALGVEGSRVAPAYFPLALDLSRFDPDAQVNDPEALALRAAHDLIVFHPSRLMISARPELRAAGQWKRNDLLIRAFARVVHAGVAREPALVMPDRADSVDVGIARHLVSELGIERNVLWLRPPRPTGYTRRELVAYYLSADVVADDFGAGWFGAVALEALALARPLVTYVDEDAMRVLYPWHPMLSAATEDEVTRILVELASDPERRRSIGLRGRAWIQEFHAGEACRKRYVANIRDAASRMGTSA